MLQYTGCYKNKGMNHPLCYLEYFLLKNSTIYYFVNNEKINNKRNLDNVVF